MGRPFLCSMYQREGYVFRPAGRERPPAARFSRAVQNQMAATAAMPP